MPTDTENIILAKLEELQKTVITSKEEVLEELTKRMVKLEEKTDQEIEVLRSNYSKLKTIVDEQEQYGMKSDVIICGIEDDPNENEDEVIEKVIELAEKLEVELSPLEIFASHRLPTKKETNAHPIIVRLNNLRKKEQLIRKSKEKKIKGIYVNHHLTPNTRTLLEKAREICDQGYVQFAWFGNGYVRIRRDVNSVAIRIRSLDDLEKIIDQYDRDTDQENQEEVKSSGSDATKKKINSATNEKTNRNNTIRGKTVPNKTIKDHFVSTRSRTLK